MKRAFHLVSLGIVLFSGRAFAQEPGPAEPPAADEAQPAPLPPPFPTSPPEANHGAASSSLGGVRITGGLKVAYVTTPGFDTFATSNALLQFSVDGTYAFFVRERIALGVGLGWDVGGREGRFRGLQTNLTAHRFLVPIEARVGILPWLWGFGKIAPGAALMLARIEDPSAPAALADSAWAFAADISAGASFIIGKRDQTKRAVRFVLSPEVGYSLTTDATLHPSPRRAADDVLGTDENTSLRPLALNGFFWRATVGATF